MTRFKIFCDHARYYFYHVKIFPTKRAMQDDAMKCIDRPMGRFSGLCSCYRILNVPPRGKGRSRMTGCLGSVYLYRGSLGVGVVTHEFAHAALHYAEVKKLNLVREHVGHWVSKDEESFCHAMGYMVTRFTRKCYQLKFYV